MPHQNVRIFAAVGFAALAAAGLAGCAGGGSGALPAQTIPSYGLHYMSEGGSAKLAYGRANSDDVGLMLQCRKGSRQVEVTDAIRAVAPSSPTLVLTAAGARSALKPRVQAGEGGGLLIAQTSSDDPALRAFRGSGRMEVASGPSRYGIVASAGEQSQVEQFFSACGGAQR
jgi:hypothetical protein